MDIKNVFILMFLTCAVLCCILYSILSHINNFTTLACHVQELFMWKAHGFPFIFITFIVAKLSAFHHVYFFFPVHFLFFFSSHCSFLFLSLFLSLCAACVSVFVCVQAVISLVGFGNNVPTEFSFG